MKSIKGFTLAEVLITLGIIGVVAVLVMPVIIGRIQDEQYKAAFKKEYSTLAAAIGQLKADNGGTVVDICKASTAEYDTFRALLSPYLKIAKSSEDNAYSTGLWPDFGNFYYYDGSPVVQVWDSPFGQYARVVILNDGSSVLFSNGYQDCGTDHDPTGAVYAPFYFANFIIDTNGPKKPNTLGKDIFAVYLWHDSLYPYGSNNLDGYQCATTGSFPGLGCAAQILMNK